MATFLLHPTMKHNSYFKLSNLDATAVTDGSFVDFRPWFREIRSTHICLISVISGQLLPSSPGSATGHAVRDDGHVLGTRAGNQSSRAVIATDDWIVLSRNSPILLTLHSQSAHEPLRYRHLSLLPTESALASLLLNYRNRYLARRSVSHEPRGGV